MGLEKYIEKRNFTNTPEPEGDLENNSDKLRFVVQRHEARRLHYDLRLEMDGVLKSWAVPKGPSLNPSDKRLAIMTEDHPVKYLTFRGTIPKGNYGAGQMEIWDTGHYEVKGKSSANGQWHKGSMKIIFHGKKLKGEFALVRTKRGDEENQWLLMKKDDKFSTKEDYDAEDIPPMKSPSKKETKLVKLTDRVKPMLATKTDRIFDSPDWIYEFKWDGYRALAQVQDGKVELYSRNGLSFNSKYKEIVKDLKQIEHDVLLDGEIVVLDKDGRTDFQKLQNYSSKDGELRFYVFDMLFLNGHDMTGLPLVQRKSLIQDVIEDLEQVQYCEHVEGMGTVFFNRAEELKMEGVIAKLADSTYQPGSRSEKWLKIKSEESIEALICGFTEGEGVAFGSLIMGMYRDGKLEYIGNCGTGFTEKSRKELLKKMKSRKIEEHPFHKKPNLKGRKATWIEPELICEVQFTEWTKTGSLRHPSFKGLRTDKEPEEINEEKETSAPVKKDGTVKENMLDVEGRQIRVTNLDKLYWPDEGFRKYDLIDYYMKMAETILPYLVDRPQNLHRHPNGIKSKGFFQKDSGEMLPDWVDSIKLRSKSSDRDIEYMICQDEATLLYMANLGCIEINPWSSRKGNLLYPDYTVIDIDPSDKNTFEEVIEVAQVAGEVLKLAGVRGYCKTSGSSGIHIYIPMGAEYTYTQARDFTLLLCRYIKKELPKLTSLERSPAKRKTQIYLDYMQNSKGQTLAAPYCLRPKKGATASAPLKWEEVKPGLDMMDFNIRSMPDRVREVGDLYKGVLGKGIDMEKALQRLSE